MYKLQHFATLEEAQSAAEKHDLHDGYQIAWGREFGPDNTTTRDDSWVGGWWRIDLV